MPQKLVYLLLAALTQANLNTLNQNLHGLICNPNLDPEKFCQIRGPGNANTQECADILTAIRLAEFCPNDREGRLRRSLIRKHRSISDSMTGFFASWVSSVLAQINTYACWCFLNSEDSHKGKGATLVNNTIDEKCRIYHHGFYSIVVDNNDQDSSCTEANVRNANYDTSAGGQLVGIQTTNPDLSLEEAVILACDQTNDPATNLCSNRVCKVETYFTTSILNFFMGGNTFDRTPMHQIGFDHEAECARESNLGNLDESALAPGKSVEDLLSGYVTCGTYPLKRRHRNSNYFVDADGNSITKSCCGTKFMKSNRRCCDKITTYDPSKLQCCADGLGTLKPIDKSCDEN